MPDDDINKMTHENAMRIYQFDPSRGVIGFPDKPEDALQHFDAGTFERAK